MKAAITGIEDNEELVEVFSIILKIGNYLNQGTNKGNQASFTIDLINKLTMQKGVGKYQKQSMLDFVLHTILAKQPHIVVFASKLAPCEEGTKIELDVLNNQLRDNQNGLTLIKEELEKREEKLEIAKKKVEANLLQEECGQSTEEDREQTKKLEQEVEYLEIFIEKFSGFCKALELKVDYARSELETLTEKSKALTKKYGLDPKTVPPKELFEYFFIFSKEF